MATTLSTKLRQLSPMTDSRINRVKEGRSLDLIPVPKTAKLLEQLSRAVSIAGRDPVYRRLAGKKRNWVAAGLAEACTELRERERRAHPPFSRIHGDGEHEDLPAQVRAPRSEKYATPGPFGRFLEDVLEGFGVRSDNGDVVSAAVALRSLNTARKDSPAPSRQQRRT